VSGNSLVSMMAFYHSNSFLMLNSKYKISAKMKSTKKITHLARNIASENTLKNLPNDECPIKCLEPNKTIFSNVTLTEIIFKLFQLTL